MTGTKAASRQHAHGPGMLVMARDSRWMREGGPFLFAQVTNDVGVGEIADAVIAGWTVTRRHEHAG